MALAAMLTQLCGGALLLLGLLTPLAALGIASTVAVATFFLIKEGQPFINPKGHSWENTAFYVGAGGGGAGAGAGGGSVLREQCWGREVIRLTHTGWGAEMLTPTLIAHCNDRT